MENERILVVDDDLSILKSFGSLLEMKGYRVSEATGAGEAITKASSNFYHLALIDVKLPDLDGTETLERVFADKSRDDEDHNHRLCQPG